MASPIYHANVKLEHVSAEASFLKMRPKLLAIPEGSVMRINLHLTSMISAAWVASDRVLPLRDEIIRHMPLFELDHLDELLDAALALDHAEGKLKAIAHPKDGLEELNLEATQTRARAIQDLRNLAAHGLIDPSRLDSFVGKPGYKIVVADVRLCIHVYELEWPNIEGKTCCSREELDRASKVIQAMKPLIGLRAMRYVRESEWSDLRARAFTLLFQHYGEVRRAVLYLRYPHDDADKFAPSLFSCRPKRRRRTRSDEEELQGTQPTEPDPQPIKPLNQQVIGPNGPFVDADATPTPFRFVAPKGLT